MTDFQPPMTDDPIIRINAMEVVIRSMLSALPPDQRKKVNEISQNSLSKLLNDPSLTPTNRQSVREIKDMARFLFNHLPGEY